MNIFYNKTTLKDTMVVSIYNDNCTTQKEYHGNIILLNNDKIIGANISNVSKSLQIKEGFLYPTKKIIEFINEKINTNFDSGIPDPTFVVGRVVECKEIKGTHLHLCKIDIKNKVLQIVCGASNIKKDLLVVVAQVGMRMPDGTAILPGKLMGNESYGMVCSSKELHIEEFNNKPGIIELPKTYKIGDIFKQPYKNL